MDCVYLSGLVAEHKITLDDARKIIIDLTYNLARRAYKLPLGDAA
jgi:glucuronate isomerase